VKHFLQNSCHAASTGKSNGSVRFGVIETNIAASLRASGSARQNRTEPRVGCTDGIAHSGVIGATPDRTYVLHSWSLVKIGTTAQKKLFFDLRRLKGQMQTIDDGDLQPVRSARSHGCSM
jgi:hypothetical protein